MRPFPHRNRRLPLHGHRRVRAAAGVIWHRYDLRTGPGREPKRLARRRRQPQPVGERLKCRRGLWGPLASCPLTQPPLGYPSHLGDLPLRHPVRAQNPDDLPQIPPAASIQHIPPPENTVDNLAHHRVIQSHGPLLFPAFRPANEATEPNPPVQTPNEPKQEWVQCQRGYFPSPDD